MHALFTGPIGGDVVLPDGTVVDVSPPVIYLPTRELVDAVADAIGRRHEVDGHPLFLADPTVDDHGFTYIPTEV